MREGFRKVCGFSFRFNEKKKKKLSKEKLNSNPAGCLPGVCETWSGPKPVSAKREITGLKWETSLQKPPRVVFGLCLFAYMCVYVDMFFQVCISFFFMYLSLRPFLINNIETLKYFISE